MQSINGRINSRAKSAGIALWSVTEQLTSDDRNLIEGEIKRAFNGFSHSSRLAAVLTAEILLRRYGAAL